MGDEKSLGGVSVALIIVLLLLFWMFGGGMWGNRAVAAEVATGGVTNCEVERLVLEESAKNYIVTTNQAAATQALILSEEGKTRMAIAEDGNATRRQGLEIYIDGLKSAMFEKDMKIQALENRVYSDGKFCQIENQMGALASAINALPKTPPVFTPGVYQCGQIFPTGCGTTGNGGLVG